MCCLPTSLVTLMSSCKLKQKGQKDVDKFQSESQEFLTDQHGLKLLGDLGVRHSVDFADLGLQLWVLRRGLGSPTLHLPLASKLHGSRDKSMAHQCHRCAYNNNHIIRQRDRERVVKDIHGGKGWGLSRMYTPPQLQCNCLLTAPGGDGTTN